MVKRYVIVLVLLFDDKGLKVIEEGIWTDGYG